MKRFFAATLLPASLVGCGPSYSPNTYSVTAVQQANTVAQGVVIGVRNVNVSAAGTVGTLTGAAAGGIAGSQAVSGPVSAFTALGGSLVGGIAGSAVEHTTADTTAFEYIIRKTSGDLVSVTQKDKTPLALGQKVLVIAGNQARVVPDYTVPPDSATASNPQSRRPLRLCRWTPNLRRSRPNPQPCPPSWRFRPSTSRLRFLRLSRGHRHPHQTPSRLAPQTTLPDRRAQIACLLTPSGPSGDYGQGVSTSTDRFHTAQPSNASRVAEIAVALTCPNAGLP